MRLNEAAAGVALIAGVAGPAAADVLQYEYVGNPLVLNEEATQEYVDTIQAEIDGGNPDFPPDFADEISADAVRPPLELTVVVDQDELQTGSVRNQTLGIPVFNSPLDGFEVVTPVLGTASEFASITFNGGGRIIDYTFNATSDFEDTFVDATSGDVTREDPFTAFPGGPAVTYEAPPGAFRLVSGEVAPIPLPAALPLLAAGLGLMALASRRPSRGPDA